MRTSHVVPGIEVFLKKDLSYLRNRRTAVLSNYSAVDSELNFSIGLLNGSKDLDIACLLAPEHGLWGDYQAGENVPGGTDPGTGLPVISLYDQTVQIPGALPDDIDGRMRAFDTLSAGKKISGAALKNIDAILIDIQDIGTRIYTYISTIGFLMEAAAGTDISLTILDRPNPITGTMVEGPVLEFPRYSSFIGYYSIPLRHGMTIGEIARMYNAELFSGGVDLSVVRAENWKRSMWFDDTGLPWVKPSPNIPTLKTAAIYPGMVLLEGTNISEGRGTTTPFELFGAPWLDSAALEERLNAKGLEGVIFREARFKPEFSKYRGEKCRGISIHVTERDMFSPFRVILEILKEILVIHPEKIRFHEGYFNMTAGNSRLLDMLKNGKCTDDILEDFSLNLSDFKKRRNNYLLYS